MLGEAVMTGATAAEVEPVSCIVAGIKKRERGGYEPFL